MLDSLVRVSRRDDERHFATVAMAQIDAFSLYRSEVFHSSQSKRNLHNTKYETRMRTPDWYQANTASHRFLFSNFRYSLTLFSKFFSSFPHGTCLLSVSHQYLALDGIYHPLRAAVPSNSTLWKPVVRLHHQYRRGYHPPWRSVPEHFTDN